MFEALRARKEQLDDEKRQVSYQKDVSGYQQSMTAADDANTNALIEGRADLQKWQQMLKTEFEDFIYQLGYLVLDDGTLVVRPKVSVACNEECINKLIVFLEPFSNRSVSITKFKNEDINQTMFETCQKLCIDIASHMKEYGIRDVSDLSRIRTSFANVVHPILLRSIDGFTKKEDNAARKILESANLPQNEKATMFQRLTGQGSA